MPRLLDSGPELTTGGRRGQGLSLLLRAEAFSNAQWSAGWSLGTAAGVRPHSIVRLSDHSHSPATPATADGLAKRLEVSEAIQSGVVGSHQWRNGKDASCHQRGSYKVSHWIVHGPPTPDSLCGPFQLAVRGR
jgi:hypothetical protein